MSEQWYREYILLGLRIDKAMRKIVESAYVDAYYGPSAWREVVEQEPVLPTITLLRAATALGDALPAQGFETQHLSYLQKQVVSMEMLCRKLHGELFSLEDEVQKCFDVYPEWIPEAQFEKALALYDELLPGKGSVFRRLEERRRRYTLSQEKIVLLPDFYACALSEVRRRTKVYLNLPAREEIELEYKESSGASYYLGRYRSRIEASNSPILDNFLDLVCHECYPGHHTEAVLKERYLYHGRGQLDQSIILLISPHCLISEGIATMALEMLFAPGEVEHWMTKHIYATVGMEEDTVDNLKLQWARDILQGVWCNAAFMLRNGSSDNQIMRYAERYTGATPRVLNELKDPFHGIYIFTYFYGKQLLQQKLQGTDRWNIYRHCIAEQVVPSDLVHV